MGRCFCRNIPVLRIPGLAKIVKQNGRVESVPVLLYLLLFGKLWGKMALVSVDRFAGAKYNENIK